MNFMLSHKRGCGANTKMRLLKTYCSYYTAKNKSIWQQEYKFNFINRRQKQSKKIFQLLASLTCSASAIQMCTKKPFLSFEMYFALLSKVSPSEALPQRTAFDYGGNEVTFVNLYLHSEHAIIGQHTLVLEPQEYGLYKTGKYPLTKQVYSDLIIH